VDCYAAIEAWRLLYIKNHQSTLRAELYNGLQDAITASENDAHAAGKRLILPASFTGGPHYMGQHFLDAIVICNQMGYPDFFITFTCNPNWPKNPGSPGTTTRPICELPTRHCCLSIFLKAKRAKTRLQGEKSFWQSYCR